MLIYVNELITSSVGKTQTGSINFHSRIVLHSCRREREREKTTKLSQGLFCYSNKTIILTWIEKRGGWASSATALKNGRTMPEKENVERSSRKNIPFKMIFIGS